MEEELQYYKSLTTTQTNQIKKLKKATELQTELYEEKLEVSTQFGILCLNLES